jgi:hypothetical protein
MVLWKLYTTVQSGYGPDKGPCKKGNESSDSVQFHDKVREGQFLNKKIICAAIAHIMPSPPHC